MKRYEMSPAKDARVFKSTYDKTKAVNIRPTIMRGGFRF